MTDQEDFIDVTADGGVKKRVVRKGSGETPPLHARCLVHYVGKIVDSGAAFMNTRADGEPVTVVAGRDAVLQGAGLNMAVAKMRVGETAQVDVQPEYGYGDKGNFSFPSVPPQAKLSYVVELLGFDTVDEGKSSGSMLFEERLEAAERRRLEGNKLFQSGAVADALGKYSMGLSYTDQDFMFQLQGAHEDKANAVRLPILLNMAACHLQLKDFQGAIDTATQVLNVDASNAKALFRRGKAKRLSGQTDAAAADLEAALKLSPKDSAVVKEIQLLRKASRDDRKAAEQLFKGRFPVAQKRKTSILAALWSWLCSLVLGIIGTLLPGLRKRTHTA